MDYIQLIQQLGFPTAIIVALGFGIWQVAKWAGKRFDKSLEAHLSLVKAADSAMGSMAESMHQIKVLLETAELRQQAVLKEITQHRIKMEQ